MRTRIKICGITRLQDALACADAGVDAIGFVFYDKSPRYIAPEEAGKIVDALPPFMTTVGLFVNAPKEEVEHSLKLSMVDVLQFHGAETNHFCSRFGRPYIKAIAVGDDTDVSRLARDFKDAQALLLDTLKVGLPGGTGLTFNWSLIPEKLPKPLILAGGLTPDNVGRAIKVVKPYAVDVSGGVEMGTGTSEHYKGVKDRARIRAFKRGVDSVK